jgi:ribosome-associated toxin RatA of RatAB toxin-antitoxin module
MLNLILLSAVLTATPVAEFCASAPKSPQGEIKVEAKPDPNGIPGAWVCGYVAASQEEIYAALTDYPSMPKWLDKVEGTSVKWLDEWTADVTYEIDFGYKKARYTLRRHHKPFAKVEWVHAGGDFKLLTGRYEFIPAGDKQGTYMFLEQFMDPGIWVPGFVRSFLQEKGSRRLVEDVRAEVARRREQNRGSPAAAAVPATVPATSGTQ